MSIHNVIHDVHPSFESDDLVMATRREKEETFSPNISKTWT